MKRGWVLISALAIGVVQSASAQSKEMTNDKTKKGLVKPIGPIPTPPYVDPVKPGADSEPLTKEKRRAANSLVLDKSSLGIAPSEMRGSNGGSQGFGRDRRDFDREEVEVNVQIGDFQGAYRRGDAGYRRRELLLAPGEYVDFGRNRIVCDVEDNYYHRPTAYQCEAQVCTRYNGWSNACFFCGDRDFFRKVEVGSTIEDARSRLTQNADCWRPSTLDCHVID